MIKDATNKTPLDFMQMAIDEMLKSVQDNDVEKESPKVGAIIVFEQDGKKYYDSSHRGHTRDGHHAEESLLDDLNRNVDFSNAEMYVTLEPCVSEGRSIGKTSCAERIVDARVSKVYIGMIDPNPDITNKGVQFLLNNGISIQMFEASFRKKVEIENAFFISRSFYDIDYKKMEQDVLPLLSEEALKFYADNISIDISTGYGNLWNNFLSNKLIIKDGKKYTLTSECGIAFGKSAKKYCIGAQVQLFVNFTKDNVLNKTGKNLEYRESYDGPMILITQKLRQWLKEHFFINQDRTLETEDYIIPYESIKEAVVNAIAHREYGDNGSYSYLRIKDYSLAIENPCKLGPNRFENMKKFMAKSIPTNSGLTELFIGTQMMNRSGSGMETFKKTTPIPTYNYDDDFLSLTFPYSSKNAFILFSENHPNITNDEYQVYEYVFESGSVTRLQVQSKFGLTEKTANNRLNKLEKEGLLVKSGSARSTKYGIK